MFWPNWPWSWQKLAPINATSTKNDAPDHMFSVSASQNLFSLTWRPRNIVYLYIVGMFSPRKMFGFVIIVTFVFDKLNQNWVGGPFRCSPIRICVPTNNYYQYMEIWVSFRSNILWTREKKMGYICFIGETSLEPWKIWVFLFFFWEIKMLVLFFFSVLKLRFSMENTVKWLIFTRFDHFCCLNLDF